MVFEMKKIFEILIVFGCLCVIGLTMTPGPSDLNNLNCPTGWEAALVDGHYGNIKNGGHLRVSEVNNDTIEEWTTNKTAIKYSVKDCSGNGTMYTYVSENYYFGVFEVVEVNGTYYMLDCSYTMKAFNSCKNEDMVGPAVLKEFNRLNNLEPIAV